MKRAPEEESGPRKDEPGRPADVGASGRAISIARVIDRLCGAPGTYQIMVVVPAHRRGLWQITYAKVEVMRQENVARRKG